MPVKKLQGGYPKIHSNVIRDIVINILIVITLYKSSQIRFAMRALFFLYIVCFLTQYKKMGMAGKFVLSYVPNSIHLEILLQGRAGKFLLFYLVVSRLLLIFAAQNIKT